MRTTIAEVEAHLQARDFASAWNAFANLQPNVRFGLEGVKVSTRIYIAAKRWPEAGVLCRVLRKDFPTYSAGFTLGAEMFYEQGRIGEAIELLKQWPTSEADEGVLGMIERYERELQVGEKQPA